MIHFYLSVPTLMILFFDLAYQNYIYSIHKEWHYYQQEVIDNQATLQQMKDNSASDPYDIKQFAKVVGESCMMVPDSRARYRAAIADLQEFLNDQQQQQPGANNNADSSLLRLSEWYPLAMEVMQQYHQEQEKTTTSSSNSDNIDDTVVVPVTNVNDLADDELF
jgi:hypothetical protein